jgi:hypothetical protein
MIEQRATYTLATGLLEAKGTRSAKALSGLVGPATDLRDSLVRHLEREEEPSLEGGEDGDGEVVGSMPGGNRRSAYRTRSPSLTAFDHRSKTRRR